MSIRAKPLQTTLTDVTKGQTIALPSVDSVGWSRVPAPCDGILVEVNEFSAFVPWSDVRKLRRKARAK